MSLLFLLLCTFNLTLISTKSTSKEKDDPLFLSPYIENGNLDEAKKLSRVDSFVGNVKSYSGLLTVDKEYNSNLFFWYFPSERKAEDVPLLLWVNGYGTAATYGVFVQNGPYDYSTTKLRPRDESWQKYYHIVYIDSPVGVGYSFTDSIEGYSTDLDKVSKNLQSALEQFLKLFPELQGRELYLTGLSLGGQYIPSLAHRIYKMDSFNLKGIFIGNPVLDLSKQMNFSSYLIELGFIDKTQVPDLLEQEKKYRDVLQSTDYNAIYEFGEFFWLGEHSYLFNITGVGVFDYSGTFETKHYYDFMSTAKAKKTLHVGQLTYNDGAKAMSLFGKGLSNSILGTLGEMLDRIKIMIYVGQTDISCAYPMIADALSTVPWSGQEQFTQSQRTRLYSDDSQLWGYMKNYDNLTEVLVLKAGHSAVTSQPKRVLWLLHNFTDYSRFL